VLQLLLYKFPARVHAGQQMSIQRAAGRRTAKTQGGGGRVGEEETSLPSQVFSSFRSSDSSSLGSKSSIGANQAAVAARAELTAAPSAAATTAARASA
jgi:hypothetical protein